MPTVSERRKPDDPKITFYKTIKEKQVRLADRIPE